MIRRTICMIKGHNHQYRYYKSAQIFNSVAVLHSGIVAKCERCGIEEESKDEKLPMLQRPGEYIP